MRTNWPIAELGEHLRVKHGLAFKGEHFGDSGDFIVLTPGNFYDEGGFKPKDGAEKFYTVEPPAEYVLKQDDLVVAMTEQVQGLLGSSALIPCDGVYLHNQRIGLVELQPDVDRRFIYYLFNSPSVRDQIQATATGSKIRHTAPSRIEAVRVPLPPLHTQRKIGAALFEYDKLVENSRRRIKILEEMAQRIYREWFVDLRYERVEPGAPSSEMPTGWKVESIGNVVVTVGGGTPSRNEPAYWEGGDIAWYTPSDLTASRSVFMRTSRKSITSLGLHRSAARLFPAGSVMMTSRATIGVIAIAASEACTNQGFITCLPNERLSSYHLYFWIREKQDTIDALASGATFKEISRSEFRDLEILVPTMDAERRFVETVGPIFDLLGRLEQKVSTAQRTRDLLLPRLISGTIAVDELDIALDEPTA